MTMRIPFIAGNWKMFKTVQEAVVFAKELRSVVKDVDRRRDCRRAAVYGDSRRRRGAARNTNIGVAAQDLYWETRGRVHRRDLAGDDQGSRRRLRDRRPLGAAPAVRRDRRDGEPQGSSRPSAAG